MPSRDGPSRTSSPTVLYDEPNSYLRPFRDSQSRPFTSALDSTLSHTSTSRRRRVSEGQLSPVQGDLTCSAHSRSRTVDDYDGHHPLCAASSRSMSASTSGHTSHHDTRPHLARLLSLWEKDSSPANHDKLEGAHAGSSSGLGRGAEERVVLVHEIMPKDSLAGVALKYGITVAELRRSNQLWASDSIHLRKVLYIPLGHAKLPFLNAAVTPDNITENLQSRSATSIPEDISPDSASDGARRTFSSYTVRRIPATRLSFFPPSQPILPSTSPARSPYPFPATHPSASPVLPHESSQIPARESFLRSSSTAVGAMLRPHALSSLVSALPFSASTRDEIISRLSFESASTSTTGTGSDEDDLELTTVPPTPHLRPKYTSPVPFATPQRRRRGPRSGKDASSPAPEEIALVQSVGPVRTVQMEPIPAMQLPSRMSRSSNMPKSGQDSGLVKHGVAW